MAEVVLESMVQLINSTPMEMSRNGPESNIPKSLKNKKQNKNISSA